MSLNYRQSPATSSWVARPPLHCSIHRQWLNDELRIATGSEWMRNTRRHLLCSCIALARSAAAAADGGGGEGVWSQRLGWDQQTMRPTFAPSMCIIVPSWFALPYPVPAQPKHNYRDLMSLFLALYISVAYKFLWGWAVHCLPATRRGRLGLKPCNSIPEHK